MLFKNIVPGKTYIIDTCTEPAECMLKSKDGETIGFKRLGVTHIEYWVKENQVEEIPSPPPLQYKDIKVGLTYLISYADTSYPCDCPCHDSNRNIIHFMPCCWDMSYTGPSKCVEKHDDLQQLIFQGRSPSHFYRLVISSVKELYHGKE